MIDVVVDSGGEYQFRMRQPLTGDNYALMVPTVYPDRLRFRLDHLGRNQTVEEVLVPISALWTLPRMLQVVFDRGLRALEGD